MWHFRKTRIYLPASPCSCEHGIVRTTVAHGVYWELTSSTHGAWLVCQPGFYVSDTIPNLRNRCARSSRTEFETVITKRNCSLAICLWRALLGVSGSVSWCTDMIKAHENIAVLSMLPTCMAPAWLPPTCSACGSRLSVIRDSHVLTRELTCSYGPATVRCAAYVQLVTNRVLSFVPWASLLPGIYT